MTTTEPLTELGALWRAVGAAPDDQLPRLVLADWLDEQEGVVGCERCDGEGKFRSGEWLIYWHDCPACSGTGVVSNGNAETAAALRATASKVPLLHPHAKWSWALRVESPDMPYKVWLDVWAELTGYVPPDHQSWKDYGSAEAAIRDLVRAYVQVHAKGVSA